MDSELQQYTTAYLKQNINLLGFVNTNKVNVNLLRVNGQPLRVSHVSSRVRILFDNFPLPDRDKDHPLIGRMGWKNKPGVKHTRGKMPKGMTRPNRVLKLDHGAELILVWDRSQTKWSFAKPYGGRKSPLKGVKRNIVLNEKQKWFLANKRKYWERIRARHTTENGIEVMWLKSRKAYYRHETLRNRVRMIRESQGMTFDQVADELNRQGISLPSGKPGVWLRGNVHYLLEHSGKFYSENPAGPPLPDKEMRKRFLKKRKAKGKVVLKRYSRMLLTKKRNMWKQQLKAQGLYVKGSLKHRIY